MIYRKIQILALLIVAAIDPNLQNRGNFRFIKESVDYPTERYLRGRITEEI